MDVSNKQSDFMDNWLYFISLTCIILIYPMSPIGDFLTTVMSHGTEGGLRISLLLRSLSTFFLFVFIVFFVQKSRFGVVCLALILLPIASLFYQSISYSSFQTKPSHIWESLLLYPKIFSFFLIYSFLENRFPTKILPKYLVIMVDYIFIVYCLAIVAGAFLNIELFKVYGESGRFGFKGIILAANEATPLLMTATLWFILRAKSQDRSKLYLLLIFFSCLFLGTKGALIGFFLVIAGAYASRSGLIKAFMAMLVLISLMIIIFFVIYNSVDTVRLIVDTSLKYFEYQLLHNVSGNVISLLLAGRDYKVGQLFDLMFTYYPYSFIIGGFPTGLYQSEMGLVDLIALLGVPGAVTFLFLWGKKVGQTKPELSTFNVYLARYFIIAWVVIESLAGHMFASAISAPFLAAAVFYLKSPIWNKVKDKEE